MSWVIGIGRRVARFSQEIRPQKSLHKYLRGKKAEKLAQVAPLQEEELDSAHYLLYAQFVPVVLIAIPTFYYLPTPTDLYYLQSTNILQYYTSGLLCFNSFFTTGTPASRVEDRNKYVLLLASVGALNSISGPFSLAVPMALALLGLYFPFTDPRFHRFETAEQLEKGKTYLGVQGVYFFVVVVLITLKSYHYIALKEAENKLLAYEKENQAYHSLNKPNPA